MAKENWNTMYAGVRVEHDHACRFCVPDLEKTYDTFQQAKDAIDRAEKAKRTVSRKKVEMSLACISDEGTPYVITGINAGNGNLILSPKKTSYTEYLSPNTESVKLLIAEKLRADTYAESIGDAIRETRIAYDPGYRFDDSKLEAAYDKLNEEYARLVKEANKLDVPTLLEKLKKEAESAAK